jgi:thiol-disulfide isomerase/thioredoxin
MLQKSLLFIFIVGTTTLFADRKPWLGVQLKPDSKGVMMGGIFVDSAAEKAGMLPGDVVTHLDGVKISDSRAFQTYIQSKGVGQTVQVKLLREGKPLAKSIKLIPKPNESEVLAKMHMDKKLPNYKLRILEYKGAAAPAAKKSWFARFSGSKKESASSGTIEATDTSLSAFAGKPLILKFWATWCPACLSTHGRLNSFAEQAKDVPVLAITTEEESVVRQFILKNKPKFKIVIDKGEVIRQKWPFSSIPVFVVADKKHHVKMIEKGAGPVVSAAIHLVGSFK